MKVGALYSSAGRCEFVLWGPLLEEAAVKIVSPSKRLMPMQKDEAGYWRVTAEETPPGTLYFFHLPEAERPDPASRRQPQGVHGPSEVVDPHSYAWRDSGWKGLPLQEMIFYELHLGTFTPEGTFQAVIPRLKDLKELGITAVEIMPVAQFPGRRNWGYDGVYPYAVQNSYGSPDDLKALVDACHREKLAVFLDVVYNHLGPEGNYLRDFGPYFTEKYRTLWGAAVNYDDAYSDGVRNFFVENGLYWLDEFHLDGLRLDAIHAIYDFSAVPFLQELAQKVEAFSAASGRKHFVIAESDLNDAHIIRPREQGGYGLDAQWSDDFHHSVHTLLTGEHAGYYEDFGSISDLAKALRQGFVYDWKYSHFRRRHHGNASADRPPWQFVICVQNHDQIGNALSGRRMSELVPFEALKLAAGVLLLSPNLPLIFMGQEYAESAPFLYFVDHGDPDLVEAVRQGRRKEFQAFHGPSLPPDPAAEETFLRSKLNWNQRQEGPGALLVEFYRHLIQLRKILPALSTLDSGEMNASVLEEGRKVLILTRSDHESRLQAFMNFAAIPASFPLHTSEIGWLKILDSAARSWQGPGSTMPDELHTDQNVTLPSYSFALYLKESNA